MDNENFTKNFTLQDEFDHNNPIPYSRSATLFAAACAVIFSFGGIAGNLVTVIALLKYARLRRNATTAFVISLSVSDLIFSAVNLPLTASRYVNEAWLLGDTMCKIFPIIFYGNVAVSLLSMVAITINRFVLISRPDIYAEIYTIRNIVLMLIGIWGFSFCLLIPPLLEIWGKLGLDRMTFSCTILSKNGKSPKKLLFVVGFAVTCLVIIVSYLCIYYRVRKSVKKLQAHGGGGSNKRVGGFQRKEDSRVTRLMLTIFLCFLLCFLPLMLVNVIDDKMRIPFLHIVASILEWASSVINPFIYAGTNRLYRDAYRQLLCSSSSNPTSNRNLNIPKPTNSHSSKFSTPNVT